jgi:glycosyltransferase involved in cell wall biosynthesis
MNILIAYPFLLHTSVAHGSGIRMLRLIHALSARGHNLYVLVLAEIAPEPYREYILPLRAVCEDLHIVPRPKLTPMLKAIRFLSPGIPPHARNLVQPDAQAYVRNLTTAGKVDVAYLVFTAMGEYLKLVDRSRCATVLDADNFETRYYATMLRHERNPLVWLHAFLTWQRSRRYERRIIEAADQVIAITREELAAIRRLTDRARVSVVPPMIDVQSFAPEDADLTSAEGALVFVGSFSNPPNAKAMDWFCHEVFPLVTSRVPSAHLYIVGWQAIEAVGYLAGPKIQVVGPVEDVRPWLSRATVFISPVHSGGGTRMKNLEALAAGLPLVTTSLGAEGLAEPPGSCYLVADDASGFAEAVITLLSNPDRRRQLGRAGREMIERAHDTRVVGAQAERLLQAVVSAKQAASLHGPF